MRYFTGAVDMVPKTIKEPYFKNGWRQDHDYDTWDAGSCHFAFTIAANTTR